MFLKRLNRISAATTANRSDVVNVHVRIKRRHGYPVHLSDPRVLHGAGRRVLSELTCECYRSSPPETPRGACQLFLSVIHSALQLLKVSLQSVVCCLYTAVHGKVLLSIHAHICSLFLIYIYIYLHQSVSMFVSICVSISISVSIFASVSIAFSIYLYLSISPSLYLYMHMYMYVYVYVYMYMYMHMYTHMYMHTQIPTA